MHPNMISTFSPIVLLMVTITTMGLLQWFMTPFFWTLKCCSCGPVVEGPVPCKTWLELSGNILLMSIVAAHHGRGHQFSGCTVKKEDSLPSCSTGYTFAILLITAAISPQAAGFKVQCIHRWSSLHARVLTRVELLLPFRRLELVRPIRLWTFDSWRQQGAFSQWTAPIFSQRSLSTAGMLSLGKSQHIPKCPNQPDATSKVVQILFLTLVLNVSKSSSPHLHAVAVNVQRNRRTG